MLLLFIHLQMGNHLKVLFMYLEMVIRFESLVWCIWRKVCLVKECLVKEKIDMTLRTGLNTGDSAVCDNFTSLS